MRDHLILFTRFPEPGRVKTRLIPALGAAGAAKLHKQMTEHCVNRIAPMCNGSKLALTIFYSGGSFSRMNNWFPHVHQVKQQGPDLGRRMAAAFVHARSLGGRRIILFGSDCPELDRKLIHQALELLDNHDLVLGPTFDGGYYLLGISAGYQASDLTILLTDIPWGTADVLQKTLARIKATNFSCALLPILHDIDRPEDLKYFNHHSCS